MLEKDDVRLSVEQRGDEEGLPLACLDSELLPRTQALGQGDGEPLLPAELQRVGVLAGQELERHDAHPNQLVLVQRLEALGDDRTDPHQVWSFGDPVPGVSRAVVFAGQDDEGNAVSLVAVSCLEHIQRLARGNVQSLGA